MEITREQYHKSLVGVVPKKYHKKMLEEFDKKELEECAIPKEFIKFPELLEEKQEIIKRMNDINTFQAHENEVCLRGTDEYGKDFTVWWDSYDFLEWIDKSNIKEIKKALTKHIKNK